MNRQAVQRWGVNLLERLNAETAGGPATGQNALAIRIDPDSAKWLEQNVDALERGIAVILRRGGHVSRALRG